MTISGYDNWKTTDNTPDGGSGVKHRCLDCAWTGRGLAAADHHMRTHHRIEIVALRALAVFSCCGTPEPEKAPSVCGWCGLPVDAPKGEAACYCDMGN